jgi:hypothetical protein
MCLAYSVRGGGAQECVKIEIFILEHTPVHDKYDFWLHIVLCTIAIGAGRERECL